MSKEDAKYRIVAAAILFIFAITPFNDNYHQSNKVVFLLLILLFSYILWKIIDYTMVINSNTFKNFIRKESWVEPLGYDEFKCWFPCDKCNECKICHNNKYIIRPEYIVVPNDYCDIYKVHI